MFLPYLLRGGVAPCDFLDYTLGSREIFLVFLNAARRKVRSWVLGFSLFIGTLVSRGLLLVIGTLVISGFLRSHGALNWSGFLFQLGSLTIFGFLRLGDML